MSSSLRYMNIVILFMTLFNNMIYALLIKFLYQLLRKRLRGRICSSYPSISQASLDELLPSKCTVASIRVFTHSNSNVTIFTINDQPLFFDCEDSFCPTGMRTVVCVSCSAGCFHLSSWILYLFEYRNFFYKSGME